MTAGFNNFKLHSCVFISSYPCSSAEIIPPPPPPPPLVFPRINMFFIFISEMEGSRSGTPVQNRASWGGIRAPEADFFFWPWRNFKRPWNCMVWRRSENALTGLNGSCVHCMAHMLLSVSPFKRWQSCYSSSVVLDGHMAALWAKCWHHPATMLSFTREDTSKQIGRGTMSILLTLVNKHQTQSTKWEQSALFHLLT